MRSWRSETVTMAMVLAVPACIAVIFPYDALSFRASEKPVCRPPFAAFVSLDASGERRALTAAKSSWRGGSDSRRMRADLSFGVLPNDDTAVELLPIDSRSRAPQARPVACGMPPFLPSRAAGKAVKIAADAEADDLPFPRRELLKIE